MRSGRSKPNSRTFAWTRRRGFVIVRYYAVDFETTFLYITQPSTLQTNMIRDKFIAVIAVTCACFAVSSLNAATIPAGTTITVRSLSSISSTDRVGRTFGAQVDQDVVVNGKVIVKAGTKALVEIQSSGALPRGSKALTLDLTSISVNGRDVAVKTNSFEPGSPKTVRGKRAGQISIGTFVVQPRSKMQFQLTQAVTL